MFFWKNRKFWKLYLLHQSEEAANMLIPLEFIIILFHQFALASSYHIIINCRLYTTEKIRKFWTNTGFSPPGPGESARQFLASRDVETNLFLIGSLPFSAITHVRIHWLLDLITTENSPENINLNFTLLDDVLSIIHAAKLSPGFEIMGFPQTAPAKYSREFSWNKFTTEVLRHYVRKFGLREVKKWRLETWNEPDLKMYNVLNFTSSDYLDYIVGVSEAANQFNLSVGGPAGLFKNLNKHKLCWSFLKFCNSDPKRCNSPFISFHKKGNSDVQGIINGTKLFLKEVSKNFTNLRNIPLANSESDFLTGWWRSKSWRADVRYAAAVAESIVTHQEVFRKANFKLSFISHDNGFLNFYPHFFTQRTLLTRFQMNSTSQSSYSQFFRKPAINVFILLALLEDIKIPVQQLSDKKMKILATRSQDLKGPVARISVLIVFNDAMNTDVRRNFEISLNLPYMKRAKYCVLVLDNALPHPSSVWENSGSPVFPDSTLRDKMRNNQELHHTELASVPEGTALNISLQLTMPSVALIHVCSRTLRSPGQVTNVQFLNVTFNEVLIFWSDKGVVSKCLKTFEVNFYPGVCSETEKFTRINQQDSLFLSYQFAPLISSLPSEFVQGCYKVRAIDYWDRPGLFSVPQQY